MKHQQFLKLGFISLSMSYIGAVMCGQILNEIHNHQHIIKKHQLFNYIWNNIDKKDVSIQLKEYQQVENNPPLNHKLFFPHKMQKTNSKQLTPELPDEIKLIETVQNLNKRTKIL